jgi:cell division protein FtsB
MEVVLWALLTGGITGGIWTAIVLKGRQRRLAEDYEALLEDNAAQVAELERVSRKMLDLEERVDSTERILIEKQQRDRLLPPA